jgi:hypothetical protein
MKKVIILAVAGLLICAVSFAQTIPKDGLVGYYNFD